jgi:hypothetical protein
MIGFCCCLAFASKGSILVHFQINSFHLHISKYGLDIHYEITYWDILIVVNVTSRYVYVFGLLLASASNEVFWCILKSRYIYVSYIYI